LRKPSAAIESLGSGEKKLTSEIGSVSSKRWRVPGHGLRHS
jgi:hypothetical protein